MVSAPLHYDIKASLDTARQLYSVDMAYSL